MYVCMFKYFNFAQYLLYVARNVCMHVSTQFALTRLGVCMYVFMPMYMCVCVYVCRSKLRELFPVTAFAGGVALNDNGMDLLSRMLNMDPAQVRT